MEITINNEKQTVPDGITVESLVEHLKIDDKAGVAVAINQRVIQKSKWSDTSIQENDNILMIKASQGG